MWTYIAISLIERHGLAKQRHARYTARWIASGLSPTPFGRRNFMKNGSWLKRIFNALGTFFDPAQVPNPFRSNC
jgi:hypothetical protein